MRLSATRTFVCIAVIIQNGAYVELNGLGIILGKKRDLEDVFE